jgi:RHS repeat-associated protein
VQNLHYTYDPAGNITHIRDDAQQTIYFRNTRVEPSAEYTYDAIYRLIEATGREHLGQIGGSPIPHSYNDAPRVGVLHPNDGNAMGRYLERYVYDAVGNFLEMQHRGSDPAHPGWTRTYAYNEASQLEPGKQSNRLTSTTIGGTTETYSTIGDGYDAHGSMLRMPHLQVMQWDFKDQLQMTQRQAVNAADAEGTQRHGERTWYVYDSAGQRVRKVTERATGQVKNERIYLGGFEIYRRNGTNPLVRETLHIMDDKQRIALVETRTQGNEPGVPQQLVRYQFGNHLGSASLELDDQAQVISYEEYTPYGSTSYQAVRSQTETPKRYRYTGKERDEESGLYYHGARYYACWLGRWISADPSELRDGVHVYRFVQNNPVMYFDPNGRNGWRDRLSWGQRFALWLDEDVIGTQNLQRISDFAAGFGDAASMGVTALIRQAGGYDDVVDYSSGAYIAGEVSETVLETAATGFGAYLRRTAARRVATEAGRRAIQTARSRGVRRAHRRQYGRSRRPTEINPRTGRERQVPGHHEPPVLEGRFPRPDRADDPRVIRFMTTEEHIRRHRRLRQLDRFDVVRARTQPLRASGALANQLNQVASDRSSQATRPEQPAHDLRSSPTPPSEESHSEVQGAQGPNTSQSMAGVEQPVLRSSTQGRQPSTSTERVDRPNDDPWPSPWEPYPFRDLPFNVRRIRP